MMLSGVASVCIAVLAFIGPVVAAKTNLHKHDVPTFPQGLIAQSVGTKSSGLTVDLGYGVYTGVQNTSTGLNVWKGIRYAEPPIGKLRWQPAQVPSTNRTEVVADTFGPACPPAPPSSPFPTFTPSSEDCLYLSVYAPASAKKLPVLVWIHGGGYGFGDGTLDMSEMINDNNNTFIAVAIQYRLGAFGFLSSAEVKSRGTPNAGILDQAFALSWVQKNVHLFGGDPSRVTISGESAGAGSVMYHTMASGGKQHPSLFRNGIAASPYLVAQYDYDAAVPTALYKKFAATAGCTDVDKIFDCLISKDTLTLQHANFNVTQEATRGMWAFLPVTDGSYITALASKQLATNNVNGKKVLVGNNAEEGPLFVPHTIATQDELVAWLGQEFPNLSSQNLSSVMAAYGPSATANPLQLAYDIYAESTFVCPSYWLANAFSGSAWHYQYSVQYAYHGSDVAAYFGPTMPNQSRDFALAFRRIWGNFITEEDPSIPNVIANGAGSPDPTKTNGASHWPKWTEGAAPKQLNLNSTGGVPFTTTQLWGAVQTLYMDPGLRNKIDVVDAASWDGGRGERCKFWQGMSPQVPQ